MNPLLQVMQRKNLAYRQCFLGDKGELTPAGKIVMADLMRFCAVGQTTTVVSPISRSTDVPASFQREGRREVFTHVHALLHLDINRMYEIAQENSND